MHGNKADNLQKLTNNGFNVPPFYVIPSNILKNLSNKKIAKQLVIEFDEWKKKNRISTVAVRSSAEGEDSKDQSFAGQFKTILGVQNGHGFMQALREVANAKQNTAYSSKKLDVNVIIQSFIDADVAGVCFTVNPATGLNNIIINAAHGLGKTVVEGGKEASYTIDRFTKKLLDKRELSSQQKTLDKNLCREISNVALRIEKLFIQPQDIEWAIKDGAVYILQARPISKMNFLQVWDSSNISESFPGIVSPLTFSIAKKGYGLAYKSQSYAAGINWFDLQKSHRIFDSMLGIFSGRMYYNLINWYRFIGLFPGNKRNQQFLDEQIQTLGSSVYLPKVKHGFWFTLRFWVMLARRAIFFEKERKKYWKLFDKKQREYEALPDNSNAQYSMEKYTFLEQNLLPHMGRAIDNDFFVMTYNGFLRKALASWTEEYKNSHKNPFMGSIRDVISTKQALMLYDIAKELKKDERIHNFLARENYQKLDEYLSGTLIEQKIKLYKERFGHRFAEDQKIESENPLLKKEHFYKLLFSYTQLDLNLITERLNVSEEDLNKQETAIAKQLSIPKKLIFKFLKKKLEHHLRIREHNRLLRGKVFARFRDIFKDIGKSLKDNSVLDAAHDIYFLEIEEIYGFLHGMLPANPLKETVNRRKIRYRKYEKVKMPVRFITTGFPYDDLLRQLGKSTTNAYVSKKVLSGIVSSPGNVTGKVMVLDKPIIPDKPFDILVVSHTDPGWTPLIALAKGIIVEHGGILSHAAIITRELGIPSIISVEGATQHLKTGMQVSLNTARGTVDIIDNL